MEYLKVAAEGRASPKRGLFRFSKTRNHHSSSKNGRSSMLEAIAKLNGGSAVVSQSKEEGVVRVKIVVRKQDLEQMLKTMQCDESEHRNKRSVQKSTLSVEQRLHLLRKKQVLRANLAAKESLRKGSWRPALQSIPEDF